MVPRLKIQNQGYHDSLLFIKWYNLLHPQEQRTIYHVLDDLLNVPFLLKIDGKKKTVPLAFIIAGSSIDHELYNYSDIDIFCVPQYPLYEYENDYLPRISFAATIKKQLEKVHVPHPIIVSAHIINTPYKCHQDTLNRAANIPLHINLWHGLFGFNTRRPGKNNDLLEPSVHTDAESIITYNRNSRSKFIVLARQYEI